MARTPAVSGASNRLVRGLRQQQAITGERLSPEEIRAIVSGELDVEAQRSLQGAQLEERKRQFDESMDLRRETIAKQERASAITGAAQLASLGHQATTVVPAQIRNLEEQTAALNSLSTGIVPGAQAVGGGALPTAAIGAAGETGLSVAAGNIPSTFTSAATGEAISTATGTAAGGTSLAGTALGGLGVIGVGGAAGELIGGGKGKIVSGVAAGAAYGSIVPGIGTVVGGVLGGVGAALGGDTVICAELHRQGYMTKEILKLDSEFRQHHISIEEYLGYLLMAKPLVERMRVSRLATLTVKPFALAWAYTMANKLDPSIRVNPIRKLVGSLILLLGRPLCRWKFNSKTVGGICHG